MSDLLSSLASAARALDAQRYGLDVAGQNIANVNTPGYTRRTIELAERLPVDQTNVGGGVDVVGITSARAPLLDARLFHEQPGASREAAVADQLAAIQAAVGAPGSSLDASLAAFYSAFGSLAEDPTSSTARQQVVANGQGLARSFSNLAARLSTSQHDADAELRGDVDQVNGLARQIASLNGSIIASVNGDTAGLQDQRTLALKSLSNLIDIGVIQRGDGGIDVAVGNGRALVTGANAYAMSTSPTPPLGLAAISVGGADVTAEISGGRMGGLLRVRDVLVPAYQDRLDELAYGVATDVNTLHHAGYDLDQHAGVDFFTQPASTAGAAGAMAVNAAVVANTRLVAAASAPVAGDNRNARALAALADATITGGTASPVDSWGQFVYRIGSDAQIAQQDQSGHDRVIQQLQTLRDQISGVSIDEEAAMMLKFQRAYEANARFFSAVAQSLDVLMTTVGEIAVRITFAGSFQDGAHDIASAAEQLAAAQRQVSSGRRINAPSDDPGGTVSAITDHATMARVDTYTGASDAAVSRLTVADSVMSDLINQLTSAKASALSGQGSTQTPAQRAAVSGELLSIRDAVLSDINTKFRGTYLFGGSNATVPPYDKSGTGTISPYQGNASPISIDVGEGRSVPITFDGGQILQGSASQHVLDVLTNLAAAVQSGDNTAIGQGLDALNAAFDRATTAQSDIGNSLRTLDDGRAQLAAAQQAASTRASKVEDADMVAAVASMSKADTAYRAALSAFATTGRLTLMDYLK